MVKILLTVALIFMNPLLRAVFWLVDGVIFIVILCLALAGKLSIGFCLLLITVLCLAPILGWLCLLLFIRLLAKDEEEPPTDKQPE